MAFCPWGSNTLSDPKMSIANCLWQEAEESNNTTIWRKKHCGLLTHRVLLLFGHPLPPSPFIDVIHRGAAAGWRNSLSLEKINLATGLRLLNQPSGVCADWLSLSLSFSLSLMIFYFVRLINLVLFSELNPEIPAIQPSVLSLRTESTSKIPSSSRGCQERKSSEHKQWTWVTNKQNKIKTQLLYLVPVCPF